jgi:hypothetical protein
MRFVAGLMILAAALSRGQAPQAGAQSSRKVFGAIHGQVLDASTGLPISGAQVGARRIAEPARDEETTGQQQKPKVPAAGTADESGEFAVVGLEAGQYRLWAVHDGYVRTEYGAREPFSPGKPVEVKPGGDASYVLRLLPGAVVSGKVVDQDGNPMAHVPVQAVRQSYVRGFRELRPVAATTSGKSGEYRITGLAPGRYYLSARPLRTAAATPPEGQAEKVRTDVPTVFCPGVLDVAAASTVDAYAAAEIRDMNFTIGRTVAYSIRGRVINPVKGEAERVVNVRLDREDRAIPAVPVQLRHGSDAFEIGGVASGSYTLVAEWLEGDDRYTARQPLVVGKSDLEGVRVTVAKGAPITGSVRSTGREGSPAGGLRVRLESMELATGSTFTAEVKGGQFIFPEAPADRYKLAVTGLPPSSYVSAVRLGGRDVPVMSSFDFHGVPAQLDIMLDDNAGEITATVLDDNQRPLEDVQVVAVPERRRELLFYGQAATGGDGRARLSGLAPGNYQLFAWPALEPGAYYDPEFLHAFEAEAISVRIGAGSREQVKLRPSRRR